MENGTFIHDCHGLPLVISIATLNYQGVQYCLGCLWFFWVWVSVFSTPVFIVSKPIKAHFEDNFPDIFAEMVEAWNGRPPAFGDPDPEPAANAAGRWHATAPGWICLVQGSWEWRFSLLGRAPCETGVFFFIIFDDFGVFAAYPLQV